VSERFRNGRKHRDATDVIAPPALVSREFEGPTRTEHTPRRLINVRGRFSAPGPCGLTFSSASARALLRKVRVKDELRYAWPVFAFAQAERHREGDAVAVDVSVNQHRTWPLNG